MKSSRFDTGRFFQGSILFGFTVYLIKLLETGEIHRLVSARIEVLLEITLAVLIVMTFYALATLFPKKTCGHDCQEHDHRHDPHHVHVHDHHVHDHDHHFYEDDHDHGHSHRPKPRPSWILLVAPAVLGICIPTHSLGAEMLNSGFQGMQGLQMKLQPRPLLAVATPAIQTTQTPTKTSVQYTAPALNQKPATPNQTSGSTSTTSTTQPTTSTTQVSPPATTDTTTSTTPTPQSTNPDFVDVSKFPKTQVPDTEMPPKLKPGSELVLADVFSYILIAPENYFNQTFTVKGFVYHPPGWATNRMIVVRYMITCCTADATPVGLTVETNDAAKYKDNTWVAIDGFLTARPVADADSITPISWYYGQPLKPVLLGHHMQEIPEPTDPYMIPSKTGGGN